MGTMLAAEAKALSLEISDIDGLRALLESQNLAAVDRFGALSESLCRILHPTRFERLREAIDGLDFTRAAALLRDARFNGTDAKELEPAQAVGQ